MKYHRIYAKINLDAIGHNISLLRNRIPKNTKIMAIIKADAYGHGSVNVADYLKDKVDFFGVACDEEAAELRQNGIETPILVLGYVSPDDYEAIVKEKITPTIYRLSDAEKLSSVAEEMGVCVDIHVKVDTGMSRIGFSADVDAVDSILKISKLPGIAIQGIFSHFALADAPENQYTDMQIEKFLKVVCALEEKGLTIPIKHISNSAGIVGREDSYFDMVRSGIVTYGMFPAEKKTEWELLPAMEIVSHIIHLKTLQKGACVSYGATYVTEKETKVATVSVGYADGYPRSLSNKGEVLVRGKRCPVVGRICMDQLMIDVTHVDGVCVGDDVVIVGKSEKDYISVEEVAELAGTFNYELVCGLSKRVPRVYYLNDKEYKTVSYLQNR